MSRARNGLAQDPLANGRAPIQSGDPTHQRDCPSGPGHAVIADDAGKQLLQPCILDWGPMRNPHKLRGVQNWKKTS
eukprot:9494469-Pyramimonas_sp.AAC.2